MALKIAVAQIDIVLGKPAINEQTVIEYAQQAATVGADILVYPEMWNTGYDLLNLEATADSQGQRSIKLLRTLAKKYRLNIVGGSVATAQAENNFYNTMFVFNDKGEQVSEYKKLHLFGLMNEEKFMSAGNKTNCFNLANVSSVGAICYDIRFPEWLRTMMSEGPQEILYIVAEWPIQRIKQWQLLLQARAIENQTFVVAANRVGRDNDNRFGGRSLIIDPLGNIIEQASDDKAELLVAEININDEKAIRGEIPVFNDRRPELYR
ncbi:carbon-nitrogen family hydrolase [Leuconostoc koreense]|nr:carbon-nitrogen family hydrolase [Leuconostoc mesenteroides]QGM24950.1 carbon-nitrogen family hydrolase [Leuconostoc mesenteroides subsp. mesenteroides]